MMDNKISVPKSATESTATLVYPPEFTDECPSSWHHVYNHINIINLVINKQELKVKRSLQKSNFSNDKSENSFVNLELFKLLLKKGEDFEGA